MTEPQVRTGCLLMPFLIMGIAFYYLLRVALTVVILFLAACCAVAELGYDTYRTWKEYHADPHPRP